MTLKKEHKANLLIKNERIYKVGETEKNAHFICKGSSGQIYLLVYKKTTKEWSCTCKNIRHTIDCSHILAGKILLGNKNDKKL